jgi:hypothetical protein
MKVVFFFVHLFMIYSLSFQVASLGGLVSHVDGLISSGISCLHTFDKVDGKFICKTCKVITGSTKNQYLKGGAENSIT